jgi:hypothetical protein
MDYPGRAFKFAAAGRCVYCDQTNERTVLGSEHIVPQGLGGRMELPAASCRACEAMTSGVELEILRGVFRPARAKLGFLSKKRKKGHPKDWPVKVDFGAGPISMSIPLAEHPTYLMLFTFDIPTILQGLAPRAPEEVFGKIVVASLNPVVLHQPKAKKITFETEFKADTFVRFLAKIGHSYAVAKLEPEIFRPLLLETIHGTSTVSPLHYIGCTLLNPTTGSDLHEIDILPWGQFYVVKLRLFASYPRVPTYYLVAGEKIEKDRPKAVSL